MTAAAPGAEARDAPAAASPPSSEKKRGFLRGKGGSPSPAKGKSAATNVKGEKMTTKEVVEFVASEARKDHEDNVYEDYLSDEAKKRFKLAVVMGPAYQQRLRIGKLKVKLIEAANLPAADLGGKSDPYARLIITGKNKYGNEWTEEKRQTWQSATVKKSLNPGWHEQCEFFVPRYDAVLRVEIYDLDVSSADDLLGSVEIPIKDLSFLGLVKRWVPLEIAEGFTAASAAVHLHLEYEVSALGEASSMLWAEQRKTKDATKFDINLLYTNGMALNKEMKPYLDVATAAEKIVSWKDERKSRTWLAICLFVAFFIEYFWEMLHLAIVALLVHNYFEKKKLDVIRAEAAACFQRIDADGGGSLDRSEIGLAMAELATKNARPPPPDDEIDALFKKADEDGGGELDLDEFTQLCIDSPSIMGFDKAEEEAEEEVDDEPEDPEAAALLAGAAGGEKKKRSLSFRKPKDDGDRKEDHKGPVSGIAKKMINLAGKKAGSGPALAMRQLGATAKDVAEVRDLFEWKEPKKTLPILAGNVFMVLFHYVTPLWMFFVPAVCGAFFVLTEKLKALERVAAKGAKARSRYVELRKLKLGTGDRGAISVLAHPTDRPVLAELSRSTLPGFGKSHNKRLIKTVVTGIFSRLDEDGSGSVDGKELTDFIVGAMPNASPRAQAMFGGCPTAVARVVERLVAKFDVNGDGEIDKAEFTEIVRKTGCVEVLTQDELSRQLHSDGGLQCVKLPTSKSLAFNNARSHATALTLFPAPDKPEPNDGGYLVHDLAYTKRKGDKVSVTGIAKVEPDAAKLNRIAVHAPGLSQPLLFEVSPLFRDPLVDLLTLACTGVPLPLPKNVQALRRGTDLSLDPNQLADIDAIIEEPPAGEDDEPASPVDARMESFGEDE